MNDTGDNGGDGGEAGPVIGQVVTLDADGKRRPSGLRPFRAGEARAREAGRRGAEASARAKRERRAEGVAVLDAVRTLTGLVQRDELGPACVAAALDMIGRVTSGEQRVADPAAWLRALVDVARLEAGEATSATLVAHVGSDAAREVRALRDRVRAELPSSSVLAAADTPGVEVVEGVEVVPDPPVSTTAGGA